MKSNRVFIGVVVMCLSIGLITAPADAARKTPIYVWFSHHIDDGRVDVTSTRPIRSTPAVRWLMQTYENHEIKAQLGFVGSVLQLIDFDDPEVTATIKRLKMPVGYHPGSGHREPCQVGRAILVPASGPNDLEARRKNQQILWTFETKTLIPKWRPRPGGGISDDNPQYGQVMPSNELSKYNLPQTESWLFGGWMGIQTTLNICPMDTDAGGRGVLYEMLGVRSYLYHWGPVNRDEAIDLPSLQESEIFGELRLPYKHYGKEFGEDVPKRPTAEQWLQAMADGLPDDQAYIQRIFCHATALVGPNREKWEDIIIFLKSRPEDFQIVWPDWDENQWKPQNSAESFYRREYGQSMAQFRDAPVPVDRLMSDRPRRGPRGPRGRRNQALQPAQPKRTDSITLDRQTMDELARAVLSRFPTPNHDADYGGPPAYLSLPNGQRLSLADSFVTLARAIVHWGHEHRLPEAISLDPVRGPIDYPYYDLAQEPEYDSKKTRTGYTARELPHELFPDADIVRRQGLPMQAGNHLWQAARALVRGDDVLHAAWVALKTVDNDGHIPGSIPVYMVSHRSAGRGRSNLEFTQVHINAAELLPALAQVYLSIDRNHPASAAQVTAAFVVGTKLFARQRQMLVVPYSPMTQNGGFHIHSLKQEAFVWREKVSPETLDAAWNYIP